LVVDVVDSATWPVWNSRTALKLQFFGSAVILSHFWPSLHRGISIVKLLSLMKDCDTAQSRSVGLDYELENPNWSKQTREETEKSSEIKNFVAKKHTEPRPAMPLRIRFTSFALTRYSASCLTRWYTTELTFQHSSLSNRDGTPPVRASGLPCCTEWIRSTTPSEELCWNRGYETLKEETERNNLVTRFRRVE
jgi:hypothetical protein